MDKNPSLLRPTDDAARALARDVICKARFAALAGIDRNGAPTVTRVAFGLGPEGQFLSLMSDLAAHTNRLRAEPRCALLLGEPPQKGDPLAFPRISIEATARVLSRSDAAHEMHRTIWLTHHPKSQLYIDFSDFHFVEFTPLRADLNGGFGKAYTLTPDDF